MSCNGALIILSGAERDKSMSQEESNVLVQDLKDCHKSVLGTFI